MDLDDSITAAAAAHQGLLASIDELDDRTAHGPSDLPEWTVGHVLTHIARNADSMVRVLEAAAEGRVVDRYERGAESRNEDIERGAGRAAEDLVADVRSTIWRLEQAWAAAPPHAWQGRSREISGTEIPVDVLPFLRLREVEVHHADLGLGFSFTDWSREYVAADLDWQLPRLAGRLPSDAAGFDLDSARSRLGDNRLLAWMLGRWSSPDLPELGPWM
jgi:maleylpyruvate isomerase